MSQSKESSAPAVMSHSAVSGFSAQPVPGSVSDRVTFWAIPGPSLVTEMVKLAVSPAFKGPLPLFSTVTSGGKKLRKTISWVSPGALARTSTDTHWVFRLVVWSGSSR